MEKIKFLTMAALATAVFASCSNEDGKWSKIRDQPLQKEEQGSRNSISSTKGGSTTGTNFFDECQSERNCG